MTGTVGGAPSRVDLSGRTLILNPDNPDRSAYPTQTFDLKGKRLADIFVGEVVWGGTEQNRSSTGRGRKELAP